MYDDETEEEETLEVDDTAWMEFIEDAIGQILAHQQPEPFLAWMRDQAPEEHPNAFPELPPEVLRAMTASLGRALWNNTPLPSAGLRTRPLPKPQRNDPCPCGSGRKYKSCCAKFDENVPTLELQQEDILPLVLARLDDAEIDQLVAQRRIPPEALAQLAQEILEEEDRPERVAELLEPLFEGNLKKLDHRYDMALDVLLDLYELTDQPELQEGLIRRVIDEGSKALRGAAWQRLALLRMDAGDPDGCWEAFRQAQRSEPDNPALGPLEITLLLGHNQLEEAQERAQVWLDHYRESGIEEDYLLELMELAARDPEAAYGELFDEEEEEDEEDPWKPIPLRPL
jgi:hypothetical protein